MQQKNLTNTTYKLIGCSKVHLYHYAAKQNEEL